MTCVLQPRRGGDPMFAAAVSLLIICAVWAAVIALAGCASLTSAHVLRANVRHDHPVRQYRPRSAWRAADKTLEFRGEFTGRGCPTWALWVWSLYEPAEVVALDDCGREVVAAHPFRRGLPFKAYVFFGSGGKPRSVREAIDVSIGHDMFEGRP